MNILYSRVSTPEQDINLQKIHAEKQGFVIDLVVSDIGVSGTKSLKSRDQGKRLFDILRDGDTLIVRWLDRLGRDYRDVVNSINYFLSKGVTVKTVVGNMVFDAKISDPIELCVRDSKLSVLAAFGQAELEVSKQVQREGIEKAKSQGKYKGRPEDYTKSHRVLMMLKDGISPTVIADQVEISRVHVYRIKKKYKENLS